jgi:hypothetical protein
LVAALQATQPDLLKRALNNVVGDVVLVLDDQEAQVG